MPNIWLMWPVANRGRRRILLLLALAALALTACRGRQPQVIKIGLAAPFEGRWRAIGYDVIYSARLAVREINQAGGIGGYQVTLVAFDDGGEAQQAAAVARALALDPAVVAVVGHWQPASTAAAAPVYAAAGLPFLSVEADWDKGEVSAEFRAAYAAVTPFDEEAGPYAGPAYDACQLLLAAMQQAVAQGEPITRITLADHLPKVQIQGITGQSLTFPGGK